MSALTKWLSRDEAELWRPLTAWEPLREMEKAMERLERAFGPMPAMREPLATAKWAPAVDITEDDKEYTVKAELPDVKKEDIKVTVQDSTLSIKGERKSEKEEKGKRFHRLERFYGSFERSFTLPDDADAKKVTSEYHDGVLTVHMAKNPTASPKSIDVKVS